LPGGTAGTAYSASINATGSITQTTSTYNYLWTVNGNSVPTNGTAYTLSNGISFTNTGGWTLSIGGTPNAAGQITFNAAITACTPSASGCQPTSISAGPASFSITVGQGSSLTLPPSNTTFPAATVGQSYAAAINASGGDQKNYTWAVNGTSVATNGTPVTLPNGIAFSNTGGSTLTIGGTPNASGTVIFSVSVKDVATNAMASQSGYSITVNGSSSGHTVNGGVMLANCGAGAAGVTVTINTSPAKTAVTDSNGAYSIFNVPDGSYTVTPSITGPVSVFYPATQSFTISGSDVDENFQAALGYTVTGTVSYPGTKTGRIYVDLYSNNCGGSPLGTSISAKGSFTIRGVPPGSYTLNAWMDTLGQGVANANDPSSLVQGNATVTVTDANVTNAAVTINDPPAVSLSSPPVLQGAAPFNAGAVVFYKAITNTNGIEMPTSYTLQWSTSSTFTSVTGSQTFPATGPHGTNIWIVNGTGLASGTGLTNGTPYYFRAQGIVGTATSTWSQNLGPVTIGAPTTGNKVTGQVTFSGTAKGPLYAGFYDQGTNNVYVTEVGSKTSPPTSPANYTVYVPTGSNYFFFGIIDQNNNGVVDAGDIQNTGGDISSSVSITGAQGENLTLAAANSTAEVTTNHYRQLNQGSYSDSYSMQFKVNEGVKLPVAVTLATNPSSGAKVLVPTDTGLCTDCGSDHFNFWIQLGTAAPTQGSIYGLQVAYSDGSSETVNATVSAVLNAFATLNSPSSGASVGATPSFSWTDPANAGSYNYQFQLSEQNSNGDI